MKVAVKNFPIVVDGVRDEAIAGQTKVHDDPPLVAQHPDCWRDETLTLADELRIRTNRVRELERRVTRTAEDRDWPESVRRQRDDDRFWARMLDQFAPEDREHDRGLDAVERFDAETARAARAARADISEMWHGRLEAGWSARVAE
jgi:hypothetical protein